MKAVMVGSSPAAACVVAGTPTDEHNVLQSPLTAKYSTTAKMGRRFLVASIIDPRPDQGGYGRIQSGCGFCGRENAHRRAQRATESADCEVLNDSENGAAFFYLATCACALSGMRRL